MKQLLINGCYDQQTFQTLTDLGITRFAFDLRARSPNLVTFTQLQEFTKILSGKEVVLIFENDRQSTIASFLDLLKDSVKCLLEFRDYREADYYRMANHPFLWMFNPEGDWKNILNVASLKGILLPLSLKEQYSRLPDLWKGIEERGLDVYLHAGTFEIASAFVSEPELKLSIDMTEEVESKYRQVDQELLKHLNFWRKLNENIAI
jgi:hypothetical protein